MHLTKQIAKQLRDVYFGGNWTASNLKEQLADVTWEQATTQVYSLNTIAILVYHMNYYVSAVSKVLEGEVLVAKDIHSFKHPPIESREDWERMLDQVYADAEKFASLIERMDEEMLWENFSEDKYGNYYRNLTGIIEHLHYHLGQVVVINKILSQLSET